MIQEQQGDVNIWEVTEIPSEAKARKSNVVRDGEATGHSHRVQGDVQLLECEDGRIFANVGEGGGSLTHEEHGPISFEPNKTYEFGPTYEYDHFMEEAREVID